MAILLNYYKSCRNMFGEIVVLNSNGSFSLLRCRIEVIPIRGVRYWSLLQVVKIWEHLELWVNRYDDFTEPLHELCRIRVQLRMPSSWYCSNDEPYTSPCSAMHAYPWLCLVVNPCPLEDINKASMRNKCGTTQCPLEDLNKASMGNKCGYPCSSKHALALFNGLPIPLELYK